MCLAPTLTRTSLPMKSFILLTAALLIVTPAFAADKKKTERDKLIDERKEKREKIKDFIESKDTNEDGQLTREEFIAGEDDPEKAGETFDKFNKNKDRSLTKSEVTKLLEETGALGAKDAKKKK